MILDETDDEDSEELAATGTDDDLEIRDGDSALGDDKESTTSWDPEEAETSRKQRSWIRKIWISPTMSVGW
ncbi:hypothetical protein V2G26_007230 [Clonostachys chloroleuca]